jgi:Yip1 domain
MTQPATPSSGGAAPLSLPQRVIGVLFSPRATFESVVSWPKWLGILLTVTAVVIACNQGFTATEAGKLAALDQQVAMVERFGGTVTPQMETEMRAALDRPLTPIIGIVTTLVFSVAVTAAIAGILFGLFAITGGLASYKQVLAIVAHAGVITAVGQIFALPLWFMRGSMSGVSNLGVFVPALEETFAGRFLGMIDLFLLWWVFVLAIGLGVLYRRRTQPIFLSLLALYVIIAGAVAAIMSAFGGS